MVTAKEIDLGSVEVFEVPNEDLVEMKLNRLTRAVKIIVLTSQAFSERNAAEGLIPVPEGWRKAAVTVRDFAIETMLTSYADICQTGRKKKVEPDQYEPAILAKIVLKDLDIYTTTGMLPEGLMVEKGLQDRFSSFLSELQSYDYENRYIRPTRGNSAV